MLLRLFLHLSDENTRGCRHSCGREGWDLVRSPLLQENSSHRYCKQHDFPTEQLLPTAFGFTMAKGNFK